MLKGMYNIRMPTLIQGMWLNGSRLMYVVKKLTILVVLTKIEMQINYDGVVFNNLHNRLKNLGCPNKFGMTRYVKF